jgi:HK97 family phage portal protein
MTTTNLSLFKRVVGSLLPSRKLESRSSLENPSTRVIDWIGEQIGLTGGDTGGVNVTERTAIGYGPFAKAVQMIASDVAKIPLNTYQRAGDDRQKLPAHPSYQLINLTTAVPNPHTTPFDLWFDFMVDVLVFGRGLLWIERRGSVPVGLYRLHPRAWRPVEYQGERYWANYAARPIVWNEADVIAVRGLRLDGLNPEDPIVQYRDTLSVGINLQKFASQFFGNGAHVGGILQAPPGASEPAIANVENSVRQKENKSNWFKTLVLRDGFQWKQTTIDPQAAQMSELDEAACRHVARIFNLPPSKLGLSDTVSYNSLEQENRQYLDSTLTPWLRRIQGQCNAKLLLPSERRSIFIEHLIDALQWADATSRATIANMGIQGKWLTAEEVRRWHNLPPMENPHGMGPIGRDVFQLAIEISKAFAAKDVSREAALQTMILIGMPEQLATLLLDTAPAAGDAPVKPASTPDIDVDPPATDTTKPTEPTGSADAGITTSLTLNGAQITAAVEVLEKLQLKTLAEDAALELLVAVGLPRESAQLMVTSQKAETVPVTDPPSDPPSPPIETNE